MEGKYTKISAIVGVLALAVAIIVVIIISLPKFQTDHSGEWSMLVEIKSASFNKYVGMKIEWTVHLVQYGNSLKGTVEKITVNSKPLDFSYAGLQLFP